MSTPIPRALIVSPAVNLEVRSADVRLSMATGAEHIGSVPSRTKTISAGFSFHTACVSNSRNPDGSLLNLDLRRLGRNSFRRSPVERYSPRDANVLAAVDRLWITKLRSITPPDYDREDLIRVGLVQVNEGGIPSASRGVVGARNFSAHSGILTYVVLGFTRRD